MKKKYFLLAYTLSIMISHNVEIYIEIYKARTYMELRNINRTTQPKSIRNP
jgi:hypothetical protein